MLLLVVASAGAETLLFWLDTPDPHPDARFGNALDLGDVNADGKDDIAVAAVRTDLAFNFQGRAYVFSGAAGHPLLCTLDTPNPHTNSELGWTVAVGDVNGDGRGDIAVGADHEDVAYSDQGRAYVFSGADGSLLFTLESPNPQTYVRFGISVAVGDVNGDGKGDIIVGADQEDVAAHDQGRAYVFSGADGSLLYTLDTPNAQASAYFGLALAAADVNGDGKADIAVGADREDVGANINQGRAYVFSGADASLLFTLDTPNPQAGQFGYSVAVGDVSGDAKADIAVGAYLEDVGGNSDQGRVYVFSGADGSLLPDPDGMVDTPNPQADAHFGGSVATGDPDGDGAGDICVRSPAEDVGGNADQGRAYCFALAAPSVCGNGIIEGGEQCDDGNTVSGDGCSSACQLEPTPTPSPTPDGVGGIVDLRSDRPDGGATAYYIALAGGVAAAAITLAAGAWYARRRLVR